MGIAKNLVSRIVPWTIRRRFEVALFDSGLPVFKQQGKSGIRQLGHRGYVGQPNCYAEQGLVQFNFLLEQGIQPTDVLCDIGCGSLRGGQFAIPYLDRGNYLGLEGEEKLVEMGLRHNLELEVISAKAPEMVYSYDFEFDRFSKRPNYAIAVSLFSHLTEDDIRRCLTNLADHTGRDCKFYASFFEVSRPVPNFKNSHPHLGFYYLRTQMVAMGEESGWVVSMVPEWVSPAGQKMLLFSC